MIYPRRTRLKPRRVLLAAAVAALATGSAGFALGSWWGENDEASRLRARLAALEKQSPDQTPAQAGPFANFAARAGLRRDDHILAVDGALVADEQELRALLRRYPIGSLVQVLIRRDGEEFLTRVRLDTASIYTAEMRAR